MTDELDEIQTKNSRQLARRNNIVASAIALVVVGMVGLAYAAEPLYLLLCQATGYDGTPKRAETASTRSVKTVIKVRFDANVMKKLPWDFRPEQESITIRLGENKMVYYVAENKTNRVVKGMAKFKVFPEIAASYFNKVECFCFTEQTLKPGQKVRMPVDFFIDPDLAKDADAKGIKEITLSYTFFPLETKVSGKPKNENKADL